MIKQMTRDDITNFVYRAFYSLTVPSSRKRYEQLMKVKEYSPEQKQKFREFSGTFLSPAFSCCGAVEITPVYNILKSDCEEIFADLLKHNKVVFWIEAVQPDAPGTRYPFTQYMEKKGANPVFSFHNPNYKSGNLCTLWVWAPFGASLSAPVAVDYSTNKYGPDLHKIKAISKEVLQHNYVNFYNGTTLSEANN